MPAKLTKDIVNERIIDRGIELVGEYNGTNINAEFQCKCGQRWLNQPGNIMFGQGCPVCSTKMIGDWKRLSKDIVNERLQKSGRDIRQIGEYTSNRIKVEFQCNCGYKWLSTPGNIMRGNGCPICAHHGYNPGRPGWIYILIFADYIKYGITNNLDRRMKEHLNNGQYTVALSKLYSDGNQALLWERDIKIIFGGRFVSQEIMPDGYTETLPLDKLQLLMETVR